MRLSEVKGERTIDVVAEIIEPIANIAEDEVAAELFQKKKLPEGMTAKQFLLQRAKKSVPVLLKSHKNDLVRILAALEGTSEEEYTEKLSLAKLFVDCVELLTDEAFETVFSSAQKTEPSSGSAQGSTADN